ncbi:MAG: LLM class flavin-dependent oxidoreductase [Candidatus Lokiarchaeota archaeon]|nr:LLM class flavin-dependent oxidoreductase [Candidatus Lokiarchaeota archaeon]
MVKFGLNIPNFGSYSNINNLINLAITAEKAGWEGFFLWDHIYLSTRLEKNKQIGIPFVDPWVALTAIAMVTKNMKIGTYVTPLPRRRPWKLAREVVSLDCLSRGRLILGIGLGAPDFEYEGFGEEKNIITRAKKCDEGLEIIKGLLSGKEFSYKGKFYTIKTVIFKPEPYNGIIPIWIGGRWPNKKPLERASKYNGFCPISASSEKLSPNDIEEIVNLIKSCRSDINNFDVVIAGELPLNKTEAKKIIYPFIESGITWWLDSINDWRGTLEEMEEYISNGPAK